MWILLLLLLLLPRLRLLPLRLSPGLPLVPVDRALGAVRILGLVPA